MLCGGGSGGAVEVGFYRALWELGLPVDFVIGSSIGALNGAFIAASVPPPILAELWRRFRRKDAIRIRPLGFLMPLRVSALFDLTPLRRLLRETLPATRFEDLSIPLAIATTDLQEGKPVYWSGSGDIIEPLIASMSLPGIFPPVEIGGHQFVDGGIADNAPLARAVEMGARTIFMITCGTCRASDRRFKDVVGILGRSFSIAIDGKFAADLVHLGNVVDVHCIRLPLSEEVDFLDFRCSDELIDAAYRETLERFAALDDLKQNCARYTT